jgi:hypothetical protein
MSLKNSKPIINSGRVKNSVFDHARELHQSVPIESRFNITLNPELPKMNYDIDFGVVYRNLLYEHIWMLDRKHCLNSAEPIWAIKVSLVDKPIGSKIVGEVSPKCYKKRNPDVTTKFKESDYDIQYSDFNCQHIWFAKEGETWIWLYCTWVGEPTEEKRFELKIDNKFDVIFISYDEPNAEENWLRVLSKAPWAKRVDGIKGIYEAHRAAAKLSTTDMFYVVDGDSWLVDDWSFDFDPGLFGGDCAFVWSSINPINGLIYENGGVKLFPKSAFIKKKKLDKLDIFTNVIEKKKTINSISCIHRFDVDSFSVWKSAFRECVKLFINNQLAKLDIWQSKGSRKKFGKFAIKGACDGITFAKENLNDYKILMKINDRIWLTEKFKKENNG